MWFRYVILTHLLGYKSFEVKSCIAFYYPRRCYAHDLRPKKDRGLTDYGNVGMNMEIERNDVKSARIYPEGFLSLGQLHCHILLSTGSIRCLQSAFFLKG